MIGPSHRAAFRGISVNMQSGYQTPLGIVPVDQDFAKKIIDASTNIHWIPRAHILEHSLEIQLPFLQTVIRDFKIVPIIMGEQDLGICKDLSRALIKVAGDTDNTLFLASTDLSHYHNYRRALELDREFIKYIRECNPEGLAKALASGKCEACGHGPVIANMLVARKLSADRAVILKYANSGDVTGDHKRVVGYLSAVLIRSYGKGRYQ